jgi:hypothetical protein
MFYTKNRQSKIYALLLLLLLPIFGIAQQLLISGRTIKKNTLKEIEGVTVANGNTGITSMTNAEGIFFIKANKGDTIIFSFTGLATVKRIVTSDAALIVEMETDTKSMDEVVVTALGVKKESKRLGYSVQEVKGADLLKAREPNAINGLAGKVAGLSIGASSEILGRPQVLLRGNSINFFAD